MPLLTAAAAKAIGEESKRWQFPATTAPTLSVSPCPPYRRFSSRAQLRRVIRKPDRRTANSLVWVATQPNDIRGRYLLLAAFPSIPSRNAYLLRDPARDNCAGQGDSGGFANAPVHGM